MPDLRALFLPPALWALSVGAQPDLLPSISNGALPADSDPICTLPLQTPPIAQCGRPEGEQAADFSLYDMDGSTFNLEAALLQGKPVLMISSSYTCPVFRNKVPRINQVAAQYADQITTIIVYTPEAHPVVDPSPYFGAVNTGQANIQAGILYEQPETYGERKTIVQDMLAAMTINVPVYLDGPCNNWWNYYGPQPNNAYLIDLNGTIHTHHDWFDKTPENIDCDIAALLGLPQPPICGGQSYGGLFNMHWVSNDTVYGPGGTTLTVHMTLWNPTNEDVLVRVVKLQKDLPSGWGTSLCLDVCYLPDVDTAIVPIVAGDTMPFYYYFYTTPGDAIGYTRIGLRNEHDQSNAFIRQVWGVSQGAVGIDPAASVEPVPAPYPNPSAGPLFWPVGRTRDAVLLFDMMGRAVMRRSWEPTIDLTDLPAGAYRAVLERDGRRIVAHTVVILR